MSEEGFGLVTELVRVMVKDRDIDAPDACAW